MRSNSRVTAPSSSGPRLAARTLREHFGLARRLIDRQPVLLLESRRSPARTRRARSAARPAARRSRRSAAQLCRCRSTRHRPFSQPHELARPPAPRSRAAGRVRAITSDERAADDGGVGERRRPRATCSGREMPNPSATGSVVAARIRVDQRPRARRRPRRARRSRRAAKSHTGTRGRAAPPPQPLVGRRRADAERSDRSRARSSARRSGRRPPRSAGRAAARRRRRRRPRVATNASTPMRSTGLTYVKSTIGASTSRPHATRPDRAPRRGGCRRRARARTRAGSPGRPRSDPRTARRLRSRPRRRARARAGRRAMRARSGSPAVT